MNQIFAQLFYEMEKHRDTVLVTLIDAAGSVPRKSGSQMLVGANGRLTGTSAAAPWSAAARRWPWPC